MKKDRFTILLAAAAMLAACSKTDTFKEVDTPDVAIGFNGEYVSKKTKAEITDAWMTAANTVFPDYDFGVYGYKQESATTSDDDALTDASPLFTNEKVYMGDNGLTGDARERTNWVHSTTRYWDKGLSKGATAADLEGYYFYAYAPYQASTTFDATTGFTYDLGNQIFADATTATTYTSGNITTGTIDLCIADAVEKTDYATCVGANEPGRVSFTFNHVLSKLTFKVIKGDKIIDAHDLTLKTLYVGFPTTTDDVEWNQTARGAYYGDITYGTITEAASASTQITIVDQPVNNGTGTRTAQSIYTELPTENPVFAGTTIHSYIVTPNDDQTNANDKHAIKIKVGYTIDYNDTADDATDTKDNQIATGVATIHFVENCHYILTIVINPATIEFDIEEVKGFPTPASELDIDVD